MIVYGDPHLTLSIAKCFRWWEEVTAATNVSFEGVRTLLIHAGQLEQAVADAELGSSSARVRGEAEQLTDSIAEAFCARAASAQLVAETRAAGNRVLSTLSSECSLTIKEPEGFAFYALYPEQYCASALKWLRHREASCGAIAVVGIRSIGTALSAVVCAALRREGLGAHRFTVRPSGHPFDRHLEIEPRLLQCASAALIVDEGPGISGSSFAAVAEALVRAGIERKCIAFLPGHRSDPISPNDAARNWWTHAARYVTETSEPIFDGQSLLQSLVARTELRLGANVQEVHDVSAGQWRCFAFRDPDAFPVVTRQFERAKFLFRLASGERVLWKFEGLTGTATARRNSPLPAPPILDRHLGFVLRPWIQGKRLSMNDGAAILPRIAAHVRSLSMSPLEGVAASSALERLAEMATFNAEKLLGAAVADAMQQLASVARAAHLDTLPAYGDGRLAPYEFVAQKDGAICKVDSGGHDCDHTIVGQQSILWDVAGAAVEWDLTPAQTSALMGESVDAEVADEVLAFYRAAYAAFRAGMLTFALNASAPEERPRLEAAIQFYCTALHAATCPRHPAGK